MRNEENPGQMLEEFRNTLRLEMESSIRTYIHCDPPSPISLRLADSRAQNRVLDFQPG